jgi:hypothetical protein
MASKTSESSTNREENLDDLNTDNGETSSKTSSTENGQNQAQNSDSGRFDDQDDLFPRKEKKDFLSINHLDKVAESEASRSRRDGRSKGE